MYKEVHFLTARQHNANSILCGTSGIHAAFAFPALLKIDGIDTRREHKLTAGVLFVRRGLFAAAARMPLVLSKSDVSVVPKLAAKSLQGCTFLALRQRRCPCISKRWGGGGGGARALPSVQPFSLEKR